MAFTYSYNGNTYGSSQGDTSKEEKKTGGFSYSYNGETHQSQPTPATNTSINLNPIASAITTPAKTMLQEAQNPADILAGMASYRRERNAQEAAGQPTRQERRAAMLDDIFTAPEPQPVQAPKMPEAPKHIFDDASTAVKMNDYFTASAETAAQRGQDARNAEAQKQAQEEADRKAQNESWRRQQKIGQLDTEIADIDDKIGMATDPAEKMQLDADRKKLVDERNTLTREQAIADGRTLTDVSKDIEELSPKASRTFGDFFANAMAAGQSGQVIGAQDANLQYAQQAQESLGEYADVAKELNAANAEQRRLADAFRLDKEQREVYKTRQQDVEKQLLNGFGRIDQMTQTELIGYKALLDEYNQINDALANDSATAGGSIARKVEGAMYGIGSGLSEAAGSVSKPIAMSQYNNIPEYMLTPEQREAIGMNDIASVGQGAQDILYQAADKLAERQAELNAFANQNQTSVTRAAGDIVANVAEMAADTAFSAATGLNGLTFMGMRVYGGAHREAREAGADETRQILYGLAKAGTEVLTEKMFDVVGIYGGGLSDDFAEGLIMNLTQDTAAAKLLTILFGGAGESLEELVSGLVDPIAGALIGKEVKWDSEWGKETLHSMLLAGIIGAFGGTAKVVGNQIQSKNGKALEIGSKEWRNEIIGEKAIRLMEKAGQSLDEVYAPLEEACREITTSNVNTQAETQTASPTTETASAASEEITQQNVNTAQQTLLDVLQNNRNEEGQVTNAAVKNILADAALREAFNSVSDTQVTEQNNAANRAAVKANADAVINALANTAPEVNTEAEVAAPAVNEESIAPAEANTPNTLNTLEAETPNAETVGTAETQTAEQPVMKRSKAESNTLQHLAGEIGNEQEALYYPTVTEKQTMAQAMARVDADRVGEMNTLMNKEGWTAADVDTATLIYKQLAVESLKTHDTTAVDAWAKLWKSRISNTGQALQAVSKWSRTGTGIMLDAIPFIQDSNLSAEQKTQLINDMQGFADRFDSISTVEDGVEHIDRAALRQLILDLNAYRNTGTIVKSKFAKLLNEITEDDWLQEFALRQITSMPTDLINKPSLAQMLKTWQVNSQLSRLTTFFRNIGGNLTFGVQDTLAQNAFGYAIDSLIAKSTGRKAVGWDKSWISPDALKASHDAMVKSVLEVAGDVDMTGEATRYGTNSGRTFKMTGNGFSRFMSRWEQLLGYSLTTSDRTSRGQIEASVAAGIVEANRQQMLRKNQKAGLGNELTKAQEKQLQQIRADAEQVARDAASYRLFQNDSAVTRFSRQTRDALNSLAGVRGPNGETFGLGDLVNPYPGVPANLAVKAFEYSPANIIKGAVEWVKLVQDAKNGKKVEAGKQYQAAMDIARGLSGAPAIALLAALFRTGAVKNADDEEDADVSAQLAAEGRTGVQWNLSATKRLLKGESGEWRDGDNLMNVGFLEPLNAFMAIASMIAEDEDDITVGSVTKDYLYGALQSILDMPVMSSISNIVDTFKYSTAESLPGKVGEAALSFAGSSASGMLPAFAFSQLAKVTDDNYRVTKGDTAAESVLNSFISNIPGLRQTLPAKLDNFGEEKKYTGTGLQRFLSTYVLPGAINQVEQTKISDMIEDLYSKTGDTDAYPDRKAPNNLKFGSETAKLTVEEQNNYQRTTGDHIREFVESAMDNKAFSALSDTDKVDVLNSLYGYSEYLAKKEFAESHGYTYEANTYSRFDDLDDPVEGIIADKKWADATSGKEVSYRDVDRILNGLGSLNEDTIEMLRSKQNFEGLEAARAEDIYAKDYYAMHDFASSLRKYDKELADTGSVNRDYKAIDASIDEYKDICDTDAKQDVFSGTYARLDDLAAASDVGINSEKWYKYYDQYKPISNSDLDATSKHDAFAKIIDDATDLTDEQKLFLKDQFATYRTMRVENTMYDKMVKGGMDTDLATRYSTEMRALEPLDGKDDVSNWQKAEVILNDMSVADVSARLAAFDQSGIVPTQADFAKWLSRNCTRSEALKWWSVIGAKNEPKPWSTSYDKALKKANK